MSKSLQDQLLNSGLVDSKKAKELSKEKRKTQKAKKIAKGTVVVNETQEKLKQDAAEKKERDRLLNLKLKADADKKAIAAQIAQLVDHYKLQRTKGDKEYNFKDGKLIKKIYVDAKILEEIARGRLCIVRIGETYQIIPKPIADRIRERDASVVVVYNERKDQKDAVPKDSDEAYYAQFEIPDDLHW